MSFDPENILPPGAKIKVIGVGGGGGNAINTMIRSNLDGVEFIAANTDVQSLRFSLAATKIQIGRELTKGLGAGADPDIGRDAALEDRHALQEALVDTDMVFITAGMGGGTGTGGASVVAQIAREMGALTVGVVTKPFNFEGKRRRRHAEAGIARLRESVDTLITIPNQRLLQIATPDLSMIDAFRMADNVLVNAVRGISDIINIPGTVNVDFADVKTVMSSMGLALMGIGLARGGNRAVEAARMAIQSPLLEDVDIEGATGILINITAGSNITLMEVNEACSIIQEAAHEDANIIFGAVIDENMGDEIRVTVIATGFPADAEDGDVLPQGAVASFAAPMSRPVLSSSSYQTPNVTRPRPIVTPRSTVSARPAQPSYQMPAPAPVASPRFEEKRPAELAFEGLGSPVQEVAEPAHIPMQKAEPLVHTPEEIFSPRVSAVSEAHDLAQWTLSSFGETTAEKIVANEHKIEGATSAKDSSDNFFASDGMASQNLDFDSNESDASTADNVFGAESAPAPKPFNSLFFEQEEVAETQHSQLDQKIDEALALAERLKSSQNDESDNLDVPAFLRNGIKDLSLS